MKQLKSATGKFSKELTYVASLMHREKYSVLVAVTLMAVLAGIVVQNCWFRVFFMSYKRITIFVVKILHDLIIYLQIV